MCEWGATPHGETAILSGPETWLEAGVASESLVKGKREPRPHYQSVGAVPALGKQMGLGLSLPEAFWDFYGTSTWSLTST